MGEGAGRGKNCEKKDTKGKQDKYVVCCMFQVNKLICFIYLSIYLSRLQEVTKML